MKRPNKSQAAVLAANTSWKRTTKFTQILSHGYLVIAEV